MKIFIWLLLTTCLAFSQSSGGKNFQPRVGFTNSLASGGGSEVQIFDHADTTTENGNLGASAGTTFNGQKFRPTETKTITRAEFAMSRNGTPTGSQKINCYIYSTSGDLPNTLLGTATQRNATDLPASTAVFEFTFSGGPSLTSGTDYWIELEYTNVDGVNHGLIHGFSYSPPGGGNSWRQGTDATLAVNNPGAAQGMWLRVYGN